MVKLFGEINKSIILKTTIVIGFFSLLISISLVFITPLPESYELSIYDDLPFLFWFFSILTSLIGAGALLAYATFKDDENPGFWPGFGTALIILNNLLLASLPLFLRFASINRTDALNHIGYVKDIELTGQLSQLDFYPAMHILQLALSSISGLSSANSIVVINLVFILIWSLSTISFTYHILNEKRASYIAAAFIACMPLVYYHTSILPSVQSTYLIPLILSLHFRRRTGDVLLSTGITISEIILIFLIVFYHPSTSLFLIAIFASYELARLLFSYTAKREKKLSGTSFIPAINVVFILLVSTFTWAFSFALFRKSFSNTLKWVLGEYDSKSAIGDAVGLLHSANLPINNLISIIFNSFGVPIILVFFVSILILVFVIYNWKKHISIPDKDALLFTIFIGILLVSALMFFLSSSERYPLRLIRVAVILGVALLSWLIYEAIFTHSDASLWPHFFSNNKKILRILLAILLFFMITVSQLNLYENPRNGLPNARVTASEMSGMLWFIQNRNSDSATSGILPDYVSRFDSYFLGMQGREKAWPNWWKQETWLPSHFYLTGWNCVNQINIEKKVYLVLSENGAISSLRFPESIRERSHLYTQEDWTKLEKDKSVSKLYDNGAFQVWITNPAVSSCK